MIQVTDMLSQLLITEKHWLCNEMDTFAQKFSKLTNYEKSYSLTRDGFVCQSI